MKESENKDSYLDFAWELKKSVEYKSDIPIVICALGTVTKLIGKRTRGYGNKGTSKDHRNYSIVEIDLNIELRLEENRWHSNSSGKLSANTDVKIFGEVKYQ